MADGFPLADTRRVLAELTRGTGVHLYLGEMVGGRYVEIVTGPGESELLGGTSPTDLKQAYAEWEAAVHPDDREAYDVGLASLGVADSVDIEYRLRGRDGVVRWALERATVHVTADGRRMVNGVVFDVTDRHSIADQLLSTQGYLSAVVESLGIFVYATTLNARGGDRDFTSPGAERIIGRPLDPADTRISWREAIHPDDLDEYIAILDRDRLMAGRPVELEYRVVRADGSVCWVWERAEARLDDDGAMHIAGVIGDATERREVAAELAEAHAHLDRIASSIDEALYTFTYSPALGWQALYAGPGWDAILGGGVPSLEELNDAWVAGVHPDDREQFFDGLAPLLRGEVLDHEYRVVGQDGVLRWIRDRSRSRPLPDGGAIIDGILSDVSEQRRAADELAAARSHLDRIAASIGEALGTLAHSAERGWEVAYAGPGWESIVGGPVPALDALMGVWLESVHVDDREAFERGLEPLLAGKPNVLVYRSRALADVERWVEMRARPHAAAGGDVVVDVILIDVTEQRRSAEALAQAQARLTTVLGAIDEHLFTSELVAGTAPRRIFTGPGSERLLGGAVPEGIDPGEALIAALHPDDRVVHDVALERALTGEPVDVELRVNGRDGQQRWVWMRGRPRRQVDGRLLIDGVLSDITDRRRAAEDLRHARDEAERRSRIDALTGVFNRRHFVEVLGGELERAARERTTPGVILLDIDHFKRVNDGHGHGAGDQVLTGVATRIAGALREYDTVARWGGEEFVALVPGVRDDGELRRIADDLCRRIAEQPFAVADHELSVTASVGAARASEGRRTVEALIDAADLSLYAAKRRGRDQARLYADLTASDLVAEQPEAIRLAEALARSASVREGVPDRHCSEVAELSAAVAEQLGLAPALVLRCRLGGWLHDVGKIAIADRVLSKPGPLDDEEWRVMRQHVTIGAQLVARIPGVAEAAPAVRHHHERWDGAGYPDRLLGDGIPIEARVVCAVDAFCAMTDHRVYKRAVSRGEAVAELRACAGSHFDPQVVDALCVVLEGRVGDSDSDARHARRVA